MFQPKLFGSATELITKTTNSSVDRPALGPLTDYRVELYLGLSRALEMGEEDTGIFVGSLIDNLAYHYVRYEDFTRSGELDEAMDTRYYLTAAALYAILGDSLRADVIAYFPLSEDRPTDAYSVRIDEFYKEIFGFFNVLYLTLDQTVEKNVKLVSDEIKRLQKEAHGQGRDNQESGTEDS